MFVCVRMGLRFFGAVGSGVLLQRQLVAGEKLEGNGGENPTTLSEISFSAAERSSVEKGRSLSARAEPSGNSLTMNGVQTPHSLQERCVLLQLIKVNGFRSGV